jgi:protein-S-isoprenylcysteine O-methyltransferase Ste14
MPAYAYVILAVGWLFWLTPFLLIKRNRAPGAKLDRRARWGVLLEALAYSMLWWGNFWTRSPQPWRITISVFFLLLAGLLSWTSARALGRQWRIDAGLNPDHQLVRSGAYRIVRHPIYTSMFCVFLGTGFMVTPLPIFLLSMLLFIVGTEIRVRIEDTMLASRFGDEFRNYQPAVSAYIPFIK